jgi:proteasome lid subunit RPN8/RPN11
MPQLTNRTVPFAPVPTDLGSPTLRLTRAQYETVVAHCLDCFPEEACGLLVGPLEGDEPTGEITAVFPCENAAHSAKLYRIGGRDLVRATLDASSRGEEIVAVWHSHTHTDAYPSPTDVAQAVEAQQLERPWLYPILSLKNGEPVLRAYWVRGGEISEVPVEVGE